MTHPHCLKAAFSYIKAPEVHRGAFQFNAEFPTFGALIALPDNRARKTLMASKIDNLEALVNRKIFRQHEQTAVWTDDTRYGLLAQRPIGDIFPFDGHRHA